MATARVPVPWIQRRDLPPVCARHDVASTHFEERAFYTRTPPWVVLTILLGVLLFVILVMALRTTVKGALPACAQCKRDRRSFLQWVWTTWLATVGVFTAGIAMGSGAVVLLALLLLVVALIASCSADRFRASGFVSKDKAWVELKGVGAEFARSIDGALRPQHPQESDAARQAQPPIAAAYGDLQRSLPAPVAQSAAQSAAASAPPQLSPDGQWWWNGAEWVPASEANLSRG